MNWQVAYTHWKKELNLTTVDAILHAGLEVIPAAVPGNFELDMMRAGKLPDLYYSTNTLLAQDLEDMDLWYFTKVNIPKKESYLRFEGIDTFADIYINGELRATTDNMYLNYDVHADWKLGENDVVVHIRPAMLEARKHPTPAGCYSFQYNYPALHMRKANHMFGWDVMPRIVSAGIWKEVCILEEKPDFIRDFYLATNTVDPETRTAKLRLYLNTQLSGNFATDYSVCIEGACGHHRFYRKEKLWHTVHSCELEIQDCQLWYPRNTGPQNLYDVKIFLLRGDTVCDVQTLRAGIRTVELERTDFTDNDGNGEFCFKVNGKRIFVLGTNWLPLDAFHSNDKNRLDRALELLEDIGCNMVRCWGGNVYEADAFYEFCDAHGILVWQDFSMSCGVYPWDRDFCRQIEEEAVAQIKRLRNHPSLALWAGDNENDIAYSWCGFQRNPNVNLLNRELLPRAVEMHDYTRPFLASSPYISDRAYRENKVLSENHLWGPRDYFKGDFYKNTFCHFASEIGYHGFPSPASLKRFLEHPEKIWESEGVATGEYLVHASCVEPKDGAPYSYRIKLAYDQVVTLFGAAAEDWEDFLRQSQISQAEAKKFFIEKFRIGKGKRTGIIWWNLLDGWPQVSDAVVDYYFTKKLAYHYIKRSQNPLCLMFDELSGNQIALFAVNDTPEEKALSYRVKHISAEGEDTVVLSGTAAAQADGAVEIASLPITDKEQEFYLIVWECDGVVHQNHYFTNILNISYEEYLNKLSKCGMDDFEGF